MWFFHGLQGAPCEQNGGNRLESLADLGSGTASSSYWLVWAISLTSLILIFLSKEPSLLLQGFLQNDNNRCLEPGGCSVNHSDHS